MPQVATFCRLYEAHQGPELPATPQIVRNVLRSMKEAARDDLNAFRVRLRYEDGSVVVAGPKRAR